MIKQINHKELKNVLKTHYNRKIPFLCWGTFGIGKSDLTREVSREIAEEKKREFLEWNKISEERKKSLLKDKNVEKSFILADIRASQLEPSDLRGIPNLNGDYVDWKSNLLFKVFSNDKADGILFFDEITLAPPSIMASLYQIILDRCIGEIKINDNVLCVGCSNRFEDKANVFEMPTPLANRLTHLELKIPTLEEWQEWALKNDVDSRILSFLNFKTSRLFNFDYKSKEKAISTPRSWAFCSKLIDGVEDFDELDILISASVGEAVAIEFVAFLKQNIKIDVEELLKHPKKINEFKEISLKYSILSIISEHYKKQKDKEKKVKILEKIINVCKEMEAEFSVLLLRFIRAIDIKLFDKEILMNKKYDEIVKEYYKYIS